MFVNLFVMIIAIFVIYIGYKSYFLVQELAITSDEALSLDELPKRVVILGGGYDVLFVFLVTILCFLPFSLLFMSLY